MDLRILKESPIFHFSLHAKELFHSNFLAWLGEDVELRPVFKAVMTGIGLQKSFVDSWGDNFEVLREKYYFDIVIKATYTQSPKTEKKSKSISTDTQWYVVIENKVKSLPSKEQLSQYTEKIKKHNLGNSSLVRKFLLVPFDENLDFDGDWKLATYSDVAIALRNSVDLIDNPYKKAIIKDYIGMTEGLVNIIKNQGGSARSKFLFPYDQNLNNLRISDLVDKWRISSIAHIIRESTGLKCSTGYTNGNSLLEVFLKVGSMTMGIQIQGTQYRRVMIGEIDSSEVAKRSKGFLATSRVKFRENIRFEYPDVFDDKRIKGEDKKTFCSYKNKNENRIFWYQYVSISPEATVEQIMECIVKDIALIQKKFPYAEYLSL